MSKNNDSGNGSCRCLYPMICERGARFPFHGWIGAGYLAVNPGINSFQFFRGLIRLEYLAVDRGINSFQFFRGLIELEYSAVDPGINLF